MPSVLDAIAGRNATQRRRVIEKRNGETIDVPEGSGLLVTGCSDCNIKASGRSSSVTIERCGGGMKIDVGSVVASLEIIHFCKCQPPSEQEANQEEAKVHPSDAADEASAIRLFTSCSEGVTLRVEGLSQPPSPTANNDVPASATTIGSSTGVTFHIPKDWRYEGGDGPRSVSRITVDRRRGGGDGGREGFGVCCKTLRCDQYGIPLEKVEAAKAGVPWTWEHGRAEVPA